jgi:hypothetical protein
MTDARFEDGAERPLRLLAREAADLKVISALVQDAVLTGADLRWSKARRRFTLLLNRYRWEEAGVRRPERVRALLDFADVTAVAHQGLSRDADTVLSLLALAWEPAVAVPEGEPAGPGQVVLTFAGDGALRLTVECLEVELSDVTRPYAAVSGKAPSHPG